MHMERKTVVTIDTMACRSVTVSTWKKILRAFWLVLCQSDLVVSNGQKPATVL